MEAQRFENSVSYGPIISWALLISLAAIIAEIGLWILFTNTSGRAVDLIIGVVVWTFCFYLFGLKINYLRRPKSVEMSDDGVKLNMRLGKRPVIIAWPDVLTVELATSIMGKKVGAIRNDIAWYYPIDQPIALELREVYHQQMGKYPPKNLEELCPGIVKDRLSMSSSQWNKKYERFKKN